MHMVCITEFMQGDELCMWIAYFLFLYKMCEKDKPVENNIEHCNMKPGFKYTESLYCVGTVGALFSALTNWIAFQVLYILQSPFQGSLL
jgi:hypothetical protein